MFRFRAGKGAIGVDGDGLKRARIDQPAQHAVADPGMIGKLADRALAPLKVGKCLFALGREAVWRGPCRPVLG